MVSPRSKGGASEKATSYFHDFTNVMERMRSLIELCIRFDIDLAWRKSKVIDLASCSVLRRWKESAISYKESALKKEQTQKNLLKFIEFVRLPEDFGNPQ